MGEIFGAELAQLERDGLLLRDGVGARLTARGRMLGNRVFEQFV
jgi:oxygen-independent coproporphyrinogen III oxidase